MNRFFNVFLIFAWLNFGFSAVAVTPPTGGSAGGSGDVAGPASSTDNAIVRFDSTTGKLLQNSNATLSDNGNLFFPGDATYPVVQLGTVSTGLFCTGATDAFSLRTDGTDRLTISALGLIGISGVTTMGGATQDGAAKLTIKGENTGSGKALSVQNSSGTTVFSIQDNGVLNLPSVSSGSIISTGTASAGVALDSTNGRVAIRCNGATMATFYETGALAFSYAGPFPSADDSYYIGRTPASGGERWKQIFLGQNGIKIGNATSGPSITASGTSPNESLILTPAGTGTTKTYYSATVFDSAGTGTPETFVTAGIGSTYRRTDGGAGTSFYVKESGTGNTGWVAK